MRVDNIFIKPYDTINDIFVVIEEFQRNRGDPILDWNKEHLQIFVSGPLRIGEDNLNWEELKS
jgi:hypothetical protein